MSLGELQPVTAYEKNSVKTVIHFGKDTPRPDVRVMVVSTMSTNTTPVKNLSFQAAVPKVSCTASHSVCIQIQKICQFKLHVTRIEQK